MVPDQFCSESPLQGQWSTENSSLSIIVRCSLPDHNSTGVVERAEYGTEIMINILQSAFSSMHITISKDSVKKEQVSDLCSDFAFFQLTPIEWMPGPGHS